MKTTTNRFNYRSFCLLILFVTLAITALYTVTAQNRPQDDPRVRPDLREQLARIKPEEFVRIIIRLKDQLPPQERARALAYKNKKQRRKSLVEALKTHAERSQREILGALKKLESEGLAKNIQSLWLSNVIGAEIQPRALDEILRFPNIDYLKQDIKRPVFQAPSWGVSKIQADSVWALATPYTGTGVVVAVLDTGMDLDHPDLINRLWFNPGEDRAPLGQFTAADNNGVDDDGNGKVDDVVGWDFGSSVAGDNSPDDWHGHGTHVAGTVAGDGTGGTATGVAPGAKLMVLSYSATLVAGQTECWAAMQYALANGADIVNFSSGWLDAWSPDYATWRQNTDNLTDGGVLFVVAAGNTPAPAPAGVLTPARAPRAFAVGATDSTDAIASFSGNGPSSWQTVAGYNDYIFPPGLLKPDVSAPGVSVLSTQNGGGYINSSTWSGTSMAAPHASGLAALLLQKNPALLPHELAFIMRHTAVDLGSAGADNVFGWGRINALAAINYAYPTAPAYDLSVTGTSAVWTTTDIWVDNNDDGIEDIPNANQDNHLYARIRNTGGQAVGNVEIKFYYADVGTIGISGFDPNGDGDPADGNFIYIGSYSVPVVGPVGTPQGTAVGVVNWNVPVPVTDHWCVGIGIVAPNPPNAPETNLVNNRAFKNFFTINVVLSQVYAFEFFVYPDPRRPREKFDLEFVRRGLPRDFGIELGVDGRLADRWFKQPEGFDLVRQERLKNLKGDEGLVLQGDGRREQNVRLTADRGVLRGIVSPDGKPVLVRLLVKAPAKPIYQASRLRAADQLLVINAANEKGIFGGLAVKVNLKQ